MTQEQLRKRRPIVIADLLMKAEVEDWHGVADAAMDLREIDAALAVYGVAALGADQTSSNAQPISHIHIYRYDATRDVDICQFCGQRQMIDSVSAGARG